MQHEKYVTLSAKYLREGESLLAEEDYSQAAEKFWGATAEMIKAVATVRRWRHSKHGHLGEVITQLLQETGDTELPSLYGSAQSLHVDFYEDHDSPEVVIILAQDAKKLIEKLRTLAS